MKFMVENKITAVTATAEDASWPVENLIDDDHPKNVFKAGAASTTITATVSGGANALCMANITGTEITVTVKNEAETETLWGPTTYSLTGIDTLWELLTDSGTPLTKLIVPYDYQTDTHKVIVTGTHGTEFVAGIAWCCLAQNHANPDFGLSHGLIDYSIEKELNNGAVYVHDGEVVETLSGTINTTQDREIFDFFTRIYKQVKKNPFFCQVTDINENDWLFFCKFVNPPSGSHATYSHSPVNFEIREVV
jgi:hypothetical protein